MTQCEEAIALVRLLWNMWGEERIGTQMGTETLERFRRVIGEDKHNA